MTTHASNYYQPRTAIEPHVIPRPSFIERNGELLAMLIGVAVLGLALGIAVTCIVVS